MVAASPRWASVLESILVPGSSELPVQWAIDSLFRHEALSDRAEPLVLGLPGINRLPGFPCRRRARLRIGPRFNELDRRAGS